MLYLKHVFLTEEVRLNEVGVVIWGQCSVANKNNSIRDLNAETLNGSQHVLVGDEEPPGPAAI